MKEKKTIASKKKIQEKKSDSETLKDALVAILDDQKAEDIVVVSLEGRSALADYMIIATGRSARHVAALADMVGKHAKTLGLKPRYEGKGNGDWVLADTGDIIVHLFRPEVRSFYNLEKIWCEPEISKEKPAPKKRKAS